MTNQEFICNYKSFSNKKYYNILFFIFYLFLTILNGYIFNWINDTYFNYTNKSENGLKDFTKIEKFSIIVIFAPVIETLIFQYIPNKILEKLKIKKKALNIVIPSLLFSLVHYYSPIYIVMTFISGVLLNKFYIECKTKTNIYILLTILLHSMYNLYGYLFVP